MDGTTTVTISTILSDVGSILTTILGWVPQVFQMIVSTPLLMVFVCVPLAALAIHYANMLMSLR